MSVQIPRLFKLAGHTYEVRYAPELDDRKLRGSCLTERLMVQISPSMARSVQEETFWHEVVEAINATHDLGLDEKTVTALGVGIHQVLATSEGSADETS